MAGVIWFTVLFAAAFFAIYFLKLCYNNIIRDTRENPLTPAPDFSNVPRKKNWTIGRILLTAIVLFLTYLTTFLALWGLHELNSLEPAVIFWLAIPVFLWWTSYKLIWK
jgi:hypothetical protein